MNCTNDNPCGFLGLVILVVSLPYGCQDEEVIAMEKVGRYYDREYDEWSRLERHKIEFDITKRYLDEYVSGTNLKVFDIGGGPGRYAVWSPMSAGDGH